MAIQIQHRRSRLAALVCLPGFLWMLAAAAPQDASPAHHVPQGFLLEKVADEMQVRFPMFAAFDERGRLFVTESSGGDLYAELKAQTRNCRVRLLQDRDKDGRFEPSSVFAERLVFPMGLVWRNGMLFVADPPDLITLEDTDGDGRADRRRVILTGFGHTDNGSLHGLTFGPDGLLYMTTGQPDGYRLERPDGSRLEGESGALLRCRADGSGVEVLCRGFENLVEIVFTSGGEILGTDNWYQRPSGGIRDALVHLVEGGLYPMHPDKGTPQPITGDALPPLSLFPAVALSGLEMYRGAVFPSEIRGNLFSAQHNSRKVMRHVLLPSGSTFRTQDEDFLTSDDPDFHPSDVLEDADGSLLVVDTGSWYVHHCPTGRIRRSPATGGIYRVRPANRAAAFDPWGTRIPWTNAGVADLAAMLADERPAVRERASRSLASRGTPSVEALAALLRRPVESAVKQSALWTLAQIDDPGALIALRDALSGSDADVVSTAARALLLRKDGNVAGPLARLLDHEKPSVRLAAAEALAHCGQRESLPQIWRALAAGPDRFLEHALIHAAHRLSDAGALVAALNDPSTRVQMAALLLLSQPPRDPRALDPDWVLQRTTAADAGLRQTALRILQQRTEWAERAAALVKTWLEQPNLSSEQHRALSGLLRTFGANPTMQNVVGAALSGATASTQNRLLQSLADAGAAPSAPSATNALKRLLLPSADLESRTRTLHLIGTLRLAGFETQIKAIAESGTEPIQLRLQALRTVVRREPGLNAPLFELLATRLAQRDEPALSLSAAEILHEAHLTDVQVLRALRVVRENRLVPVSMLLPAWRRVTSDRASRELLSFLAGSVRQGIQIRETDLEKVLEKLPRPTSEQAADLRSALREQTESDRSKLTRYESLLAGGDIERGRTVFRSAQAACSVCHAIGSEGGRIGPDLTRVGAIRSGRDILESILLPSSTFAQGFEPYVAIATNGDELSGVIERQLDDAVVLRQASGAETRLNRASLRELRRQELSLMPEGLEAALTKEQFQDLLAFLQSLK